MYDIRTNVPDDLSTAVLRGQVLSIATQTALTFTAAWFSSRRSSPEIDPALAERAAQLFDEQFGDADDQDRIAQLCGRCQSRS